MILLYVVISRQILVMVDGPIMKLVSSAVEIIWVNGSQNFETEDLIGL